MNGEVHLVPKKKSQSPSTPPKKLGQPTKFKPEYCAMLIEHMRGGLSYQSFAGVAQVNKDTLNEWVKAHPEWAEAKDIGSGLSQIYWEKLGLRGIKGEIEGFVASAWIFNMKNRFNWRDQKDVKVDSNVKQDTTVKVKDDREQVKALIGALLDERKI